MEIKFAPGFGESVDRLFSMNPRYLIPRVLNNARWEVVYAWQRLTKGFDNIDVIGMHSRHTERMITLLKEMKKSKHGIPMDMMDHQDDDVAGLKRWHAVLDEMIDGFEAARQLDEMEYHHDDDTGSEDWEPRRLAMVERFDRGFALFHKHYFSLWT